MTVEEVINGIEELLYETISVYSMNLDECRMVVPMEFETLIKINQFGDIIDGDWVQGVTLYFADHSVIRLTSQRVK